MFQSLYVLSSEMSGIAAAIKTNVFGQTLYVLHYCPVKKSKSRKSSRKALN